MKVFLEPFTKSCRARKYRQCYHLLSVVFERQRVKSFAGRPSFVVSICDALIFGFTAKFFFFVTFGRLMGLSFRMVYMLIKIFEACAFDAHVTFLAVEEKLREREKVRRVECLI